MKHRLRSKVLPLGCLCLAALPALAQEARIKRVPAGSSAAIDGKQLYREYCAVCHGTEARGGGPAAAALKKAPADLTQIARKNAGKFPEARVKFVIDGEGAVISAHGSRDMPIWGGIFRHTGSDRDLGAVKVFNLVKYIESLQSK